MMNNNSLMVITQDNSYHVVVDGDQGVQEVLSLNADTVFGVFGAGTGVVKMTPEVARQLVELGKWAQQWIDSLPYVDAIQLAQMVERGDVAQSDLDRAMWGGE